MIVLVDAAFGMGLTRADKTFNNTGLGNTRASCCKCLAAIGDTGLSDTETLAYTSRPFTVCLHESFALRMKSVCDEF